MPYNIIDAITFPYFDLCKFMLVRASHISQHTCSIQYSSLWFLILCRLGRRSKSWRCYTCRISFHHYSGVIMGEVASHQPRDCLLNRLFRRRSKKTSKLSVTGLCAGNSLVTGELPAQMASNAENVSIWWRRHDIVRPCSHIFMTLHLCYRNVSRWTDLIDRIHKFGFLSTSQLQNVFMITFIRHILLSWVFT